MRFLQWAHIGMGATDPVEAAIKIEGPVGDPSALHQVQIFLRWSLVRKALARGWWLVTAVYLVASAHLTPFQLLLIGVVQGMVAVVAEMPAGVLAYSVSRRQTFVLAHLVIGFGMAMTGFVTSFPLLVISNSLWGLGWALSSGADVAWITDELDRPDLIDQVLAAQGKRDLLGSAIGIVGCGALG